MSVVEETMKAVFINRVRDLLFVLSQYCRTFGCFFRVDAEVEVVMGLSKVANTAQVVL